MEVLLKILGQRMNVTEAVVFSRLYADMTTVSYYGTCSAVSDVFSSFLLGKFSSRVVEQLRGTSRLKGDIQQFFTKLMKK